MKISEKVRALLNAEISNYRVSKDTGVSESLLSLLKNGNRDIGGISLEIAETLADYYDEYKAGLIYEDKVDWFDYNDALAKAFKEVVASQRDLANGPESYPDDEKLAGVMEELFKDMLADPDKLKIGYEKWKSLD